VQQRMEQSLLTLKHARHVAAEDRSQADQQAEEQGNLNDFIYFH
jgi:hypothetical protein